MTTLLRHIALLCTFMSALAVSAQHFRAPLRIEAPMTVLEENFDLFTAGTEYHPDETDLCLESLGWCIDPKLLHTPGWNGGGVYQAGGCAFIYAYEAADEDGQMRYYLGYLESPRFDASAGRGTFKVSFRARSVRSQDWLGVCAVPTKQSEAQQKFAVIGSTWGYYEVTLDVGDANTCIQFEPLEDGCYIDDICVTVDGNEYGGEDVYKLPTPALHPVTDYSTEGYTASWDAVDGADDYGVYDYLCHTTRKDGEAFDYVNADFANLTQGSIGQPEPIVSEWGYFTFLDDVMGRADWVGYRAMAAGGCLAFPCSGNDLMPTGLESPNFQLAEQARNLYVSFDARSTAGAVLSIYAYGDDCPLGEGNVTTTDEWQTYSFCIDHVESPYASLEFVVDNVAEGYLYLDNVRVWQELSAGFTGRVAVAFYATEETSVYVATPDTPEDHHHAFSVCAYKNYYDDEGDVIDYDMSRWSELVYADGFDPDGIRRIERCPGTQALRYGIDGRRAGRGSRLYIDAGGKHMR